MGIFDFFQKGKEEVKKQPTKADLDYEILKYMQDLHPWLVRTTVDDVYLAKLMPCMDIVLIRDRNKLSIKTVDEAIAIIEKGINFNIFKDDNLIGLVYSFIFAWLRFLCLRNNRLYKTVISCCFDDKNMLQSQVERTQYIKGRFLQMGIMPNQVNDLYYIIKGYMDTMYLTGEKVVDNMKEFFIINDNTGKQKQYLEEINTKFGDTENVRSVNNLDDIANLITRDFIIGKDVKIEVDIKPS